MKYIYGIDIGGTNIKFGLFNYDSKLITKTSVKTIKNVELFHSIAEEIIRINEEFNISTEDIFGIALGLPCAVNNNYVKSVVNLDLKEVDVEEELRKYLNFDFKFLSTNDANAATFGEFKQLNDKENIIMLTLGTGIGSGIVINSKIVEGLNGYAGEIGHIKTANNYNFKCGCGDSGCFETVASANGLVNIAKKYEKDNNISIFSDGLTSEDIVNKVKENSCHEVEIFDIFCKELAKGLIEVSKILNPQVIILGGGLANSKEVLLNKVRNIYNELLPDYFKQLSNTEIVLAKLGNDAGIIGLFELIKQ